MKRVKAACICQTLHFMLKEDVGHDYAVKLVKEEVVRYKRDLERKGIRYNLDGVLYSMPVSDVLTFVLAALLLHRTYGQLKTA